MQDHSDNQQPQPYRVRVGCFVTLRNNDDNRVTKYKVVRSLYSSNNAWAETSIKETPTSGSLSVSSPLGASLIGKKAGDIVGKYKVMLIEGGDHVVQNIQDSYEQDTADKANKLKMLLEKIRSGEWVKAYVTRIHHVCIPVKTRRANIKTSFLPDGVMESIVISNMAAEATNLYRIDLFLYLDDDHEIGAMAEMLIERDTVSVLCSDVHNPLPKNCLNENYDYVVADEQSSEEGMELVHGLEVKLSPEDSSFTCRTAPHSTTNHHYMRIVHEDSCECY